MVIEYVKKAELKAQKRLARRLKSKVKRLKKAKRRKLATKIKQRKEALQAAIERRRLLMALVKEKKPVSVLRRIEDKIPNVLIKRRDEEIKPTFLGKGGLI